MATFGSRLKDLRKTKQLTQSEFSKSLGEKMDVSISKSSISAYENDISIPEMNVLTSIADYFECSIDYLLCRSDIKTPRVEPIYQAFHSLSTDELTKEEIELLENMIHQFKKNRGIID